MTAVDMGMLLVRIAVFGVGLLIVAWTLVSAIKTFVVPRGLRVRLTSAVFQFMLMLFQLRNKRRSSYEDRDRSMALFAPLTLFVLPVVFLTLVLLGYALMFWAVDASSWRLAFRVSGSSLLTLGYATVNEIGSEVLEFSAAMLGLILVALLIAYLPTMYAAFTRRETAVALLEGYAGTPPTAEQLIARVWRNGELENLREFWLTWQTWFAEIEESHTSLAPLAFFRSPQPDRSWVTAAGAVLDTAALVLSTVDTPWEPSAALCIRGGYLALRRIGGYFGRPFDDSPRPDDPISISREEFDMVYDGWLAEGVPLVADREQAWRDFAGWRVNYDAVLLGLAAMTMAPYAPWSSDRSAVVVEARGA